MLKSLEIHSTKAQEILDITQKIKAILDESKIENGVCLVYCPHTTAAITINECADPDVKYDILKELNKIVPLEDNYKHVEGNSAAHIKSSLIGASKNLIIENGKLVLGTWQGILFCEFDGPRKRKIFVKIKNG